VACELRGEGLIGRRACQVICDRTHLVMKNSLGVLTGLDRTLSRAVSCALHRCVWSMVESVLTDFVTVGNRHAKFKTMTRGAIWGPDAGVHVRSTRPTRPVAPRQAALRAQRLYFFGASINSVWPAQRHLSWHFDILDILVSLIKHLSLISIIDSSS
jgi:hypothetical protein